MTKAERMENLRKWGSKDAHVRFICDHPRLAGLHPIDRAYFEEDVQEIIDIAFERGICAGREYARAEFLAEAQAEFLAALPMGRPQ